LLNKNRLRPTMPFSCNQRRTSYSVQEAIEQANAEREFQQALDLDMHFRGGYSNMAIANTAMKLTKEGKSINRARLRHSDVTLFFKSDIDMMSMYVFLVPHCSYFE
jgi:hypothetical protein